MTIADIRTICKKYGLVCNEIVKMIDTSRSEDDKRCSYIIDNKYVVKLTNTKAITETFLEDVERLVKRYLSIGVYCPRLIRNIEGKLSHKLIKEEKEYTCYIEEYAVYSFYKEDVEGDYDFKKGLVSHLGVIAKEFTNVDLSKTRSMWSLIELGPFDTDRDEKQENLDKLTAILKEKGYEKVADKLIEANIKSRGIIKGNLDRLPRCVYQGDLNFTNILIDEDEKFKGIIDFNMFGTEVNINCFLNETMYYLTIDDFKELNAKEIFYKMRAVQEDMMSEILSSYELDKIESCVIEDYRKVIYISFFPNVMLWIYLIDKCDMGDKVVELLNIILKDIC